MCRSGWKWGGVGRGVFPLILHSLNFSIPYVHSWEKLHWVSTKVNAILCLNVPGE